LIVILISGKDLYNRGQNSWNMHKLEIYYRFLVISCYKSHHHWICLIFRKEKLEYWR